MTTGSYWGCYGELAPYHNEKGNATDVEKKITEESKRFLFSIDLTSIHSCGILLVLP